MITPLRPLLPVTSLALVLAVGLTACSPSEEESGSTTTQRIITLLHAQLK